MKSHRITGGGGIQLHVAETGNSQGRAVLFIHGFSQCGLSWSKQMGSDLVDDHRLVAMDLRGHGQSEKPKDAYGDSKLWAEDVRSVIGTLGLDHPILCGWSYGALVILDYIRFHGDMDIGGINFVDGLTKLGSDEAMAVITPEFLALVSGFFSTDFEQSIGSLDSFIRMVSHRELSPEEYYPILGFNVSVPPYVREGLFSRALDNDDVLPKISKPVLVTHGEKDALLIPAIVEQFRSGIAHLRTSLYPNVGHAPFWEDTERFNRELREFAKGP